MIKNESPADNSEVKKCSVFMTILLYFMSAEHIMHILIIIQLSAGGSNKNHGAAAS